MSTQDIEKMPDGRVVRLADGRVVFRRWGSDVER